MNPLDVAALALHAASTIVVLGYYVVLGRVLLPALRRTLAGPDLGEALVAVERRAVPLVGASIGAFIISGAFLFGIADRSAGVGEVFVSTWAVLMFVKHMLVFGMVALGFGIHRLVADVAAADSDPARDTALSNLGLAADGQTALGVVVLLLTAAAQLS